MIVLDAGFAVSVIIIYRIIAIVIVVIGCVVVVVVLFAGMTRSIEIELRRAAVIVIVSVVVGGGCSVHVVSGRHVSASRWRVGSSRLVVFTVSTGAHG